MVKNEIVPVVFAVDENYVPYCAIAILSLIDHASTEKQYSIYILHTGLKKKDIGRLEQLSVSHIEIKCVNIEKWLPKYKIYLGQFPISAVYRLVIPQVFSQFDKVLYLDSDIAINKDIADLYDIDIGTMAIGGVVDMNLQKNAVAMERYIRDMLNLSIEDYINSGVLLFNIRKFRDDMLAEKCFELLSKRPYIRMPDQDALNILCRDSIYYLPSKWNFMWEAVEEGEYVHPDDIGIVHYAPNKAWNVPGQIYGEYFWNYARQSGFYEEILQKSNKEYVHRTIAKVLSVCGGPIRIAVYGAGRAGIKYVEELLSLDFLKIVVWVDQDYESKKECPLPVERVENLYSVEFDRVIITIRDPELSEQIKQMLISNNIPEDKITQNLSSSFTR